MLSRKNIEALARQIAEGLFPSIDGEQRNFLRSDLSRDFFSGLASHFWKMFARANADTGHVRMILNGQDRHPASFYESRIGDGLIVHSRLDDNALNYCLSNGGTAVIDHVNDYSPVAQVLQEAVEARVGGVCWIQCYVTCSQESAFNMHADDHPFVLCQIAGRKQWNHSGNMESYPSSVTYEPGDMAFYPRGFEHDVSGLGDLTMHLTIAFDSADTLEWSKRIGNGLPYSLGAPVASDTAARLALRNRTWSAVDGRVRIDLGAKRLALDPIFEPVLDALICSPRQTPDDITSKLGLSIDQLLSFWQFGFKEGLLFTPVMDDTELL